MEIPLLKEIMIIFILSIVVILACYRVKLPAIVGFLITGVLAGPHSFGFVSHVDDVEMLANVGIILLLFSVGMEFSINKIIEYRRYFFIGGALQVALTSAAGFAIGYLTGLPLGESLFLGFLLSLSSTAIVIRMLDDKGQTDSPQGKFIVGVLIFQDIIAIPMMLMTPMLSGAKLHLDLSFWHSFVQALLILGAVVVAAHYLIPHLLYQIARTRSRELFLLSVLTICFSVAWVTSSVGLSLSLGAFLAGLIVSDSEYRHEAVSDVLPFQDIFTSFFFVSVGMLLDVSFFLEQPLIILFTAVAVILLKSFAAGLSSLLLGMPLRIAILSGVALAQVGEFSFVLAKNGVALGLGSDYYYQFFLVVSLFTMALTPVFTHFSQKIAASLENLPLPSRIIRGGRPIEGKTPEKLVDHTIIIGFGPAGQHLARSLTEACLPYIVLEMNPKTVKEHKAKGERIIFGDATHLAVLNHLNLEYAKTIAILINDFTATQRIIRVVRSQNPRIYLISRTHYIHQVQALYESGASEVVSDEFGSSLEIFTRVLKTCAIDEQKIFAISNLIREEGLKMHQRLSRPETKFPTIEENKPYLDAVAVHSGK